MEDNTTPELGDTIETVRERYEALLEEYEKLKTDFEKQKTDCFNLALILQVYSNSKNWKKIWDHPEQGYMWAFKNRNFFFGEEDMPPEKLIERVNRMVTIEHDDRKLK
jgi:hypothetical protein